jgi:Protein of unknown function (DUF3048) N-terminal domain/Protein of unknown function (DUF3048) C-terminal domain
MRRTAILAIGALAVVGGLGLGMFAALASAPTPSHPTGSNNVAGLGSARPAASPPPTGGPSLPPASPPPSAEPTPTPSPTPVLVPAPLTGRLVSPAAAARHPIAVMVDDLSPARPQSGFNSASIVWQAPAEGGIPRYMMVFQENIPTDVGPVRSSRYYYIAWAAELDALYAHAGGSPQALATLRNQGSGQLVYNADEFRWGNSFRRSPLPLNVYGQQRVGPHNLYTTGKQLREIARTVGAKDGPISWPWTFAPDAPLADRPTGGKIQVTYSNVNAIRFDYDRFSNTYLRSVTGEKKQIDGATGKRVAPKNVVVMVVKFGPLNDGSKKHRLEGDVIGSGHAWISTNGVTIQGTWKKTSLKSPTRFFDKAGNPVVLTVGQTFVQVMKTTDVISFTAGKPVPPDVFGHGMRAI